MRTYNGFAAVNHPRLVVSGNPNLEMSQLSMDSSLRTNSQSTTFLDVPLGQPSASMGSHNSRSRSSKSSAEEQLQQCCFPSEGNPSSVFSKLSERSEHGSLPGVIRKANSSFTGGPMKSSLRPKKIDKVKRTRFAGIGDSRGAIHEYANNEGLKSYGSQCTPQSEYRVQVPTTTRGTNYGQIASHLACSPYHPQSQRRHEYAEGSNAFLQNSEERFDYSCRGSDYVRVLKSSDSGRKSSSIALVDPLFSKIATPRRKLAIPYPPLNSQLQRPRRIQRQEKTQIYDRAIDNTRPNLKSRNETKAFTPPKNETDEAGAGEASCINGANEGNSGSPESNEDEELTFTHDHGSVSGSGVVRNPSSTCGSTTGTRTSVDSSNYHSGRRSKVDEHGKPDTPTKEDMEHMKRSFQKLLGDMECEAKANFEKVVQTIASTTESNLEKNAKTIEDATKFELGKNADAIQEATQNNLDLIDQKNSNAEKEIENLFESKTLKLKEIASASVEKLEVCTASGISRLSKFTETWLANSCNLIANRLKPYLFLSCKTGATDDADSTIFSGRTTIVKKGSIKGHSVFESTDSAKLNRKSLISTRQSQKKNPVNNCPSSREGEVSPTQGSESVSQKRVDKVPVRPLRRSKRMRQWNNQKACMSTDEKQTSVTNMASTTDKKEQSRDSPPISSKGKKKARKYVEADPPLTITNKDKALCVTPTAGNSQSLKKSNESSERRAIGSFKASKIKPNVSNLQQSKRRKRRNTKSPVAMKRAKTQCDSSRGSVPSEVVAVKGFQLSPLEDLDEFSFSKMKKDRNTVVSGATTASELSSLSRKKKRNTVSRTYKRRKKIYDVMENDMFNF